MPGIFLRDDLPFLWRSLSEPSVVCPSRLLAEALDLFSLQLAHEALRALITAAEAVLGNQALPDGRGLATAA
jgi:hypothetical protein